MVKELEEIDFKTAPWTEIDDALMSYDTKCASRDYLLGNALLDIEERVLWKDAGASSLANYFQRRLGWDPHTTNERRRTALALKNLPLLSAEAREGKLRYSHLREITRSANAQNEQKWIDWARDKTAHEVWLHTKVRGPDAGPDDKPKPELMRMLLRLECTGEEWSFLINITDEVIRDAGEAGREMSRAHALKLALESKVGTIDVHATYCPSCLEGGVLTRGEFVPLSASTIEKYLCEGRVIGPNGQILTRSIPADQVRAALHRAKGRCEVPGCRHRWFINVHHLKLFSEGGTHALSNLVVLCSLHHGLIHSGVLWIVGDRETALRFTHADGTPLGEVPNQTRVEALQTAFHTLVDRGMPEGMVRDALEEVRGMHLRTVEQILEAVAPVLARLAKERRKAANSHPEVVAERGFESHVGLFTAAAMREYGTEAAMVS